MGVYTIQTPDGRKLDIEAADENSAISGAKDWVSKNPKPPVDLAREAMSPFRGFNKGLDATFNLPNYAVNAAGALINKGAEVLGYKRPLPDQLIEPARLATRFNDNYEPQTTLGRVGETIGEVAGSSVIPEAGLMAKAGSMTPQALKTAAPVLSRIASEGPVQTLKSAVAPTIGAGIGVDVARENDLGPIGELAGGLIGGIAVPNALNIASRSLAAGNAAKEYLGQQFARARDPQLAADQDTTNALLKAGVQPKELFQEFAPTPSSQLRARGIDDSGLADMISRASGGEPVDSIAQSYKIAPDTLRNYLRQHKAENPTPRNVLDVVQDRTNVGQAAPVLRLGRTAFGIADEGQAAGALTARQNDQYGRMVGIIRQAAKGRDYDQTLSNLEETLGAKSNAAYSKARANAQPFDLKPAISAARNAAFESAGAIKTGLENAIDLFFEPVMGPNGKVRALGQPISDIGRFRAAREALDQMISTSKNNVGEATPLTRKLSAFRRSVNEIMRKANPEFAAADDQFSGAKSTQELMKRGEQLTTQLGGKSEQFFKDFNRLNPDQRDVVRMAFLRKLENQAARPQEGAAIANQFRSNAVKQTIERLFGPERPTKGMSAADKKAMLARNKENARLGQNLIKQGRREATTTHTLNAVTNRGNTQTAPWLRDMQIAEEGAGAVGDAVTLNWRATLNRVGKKLANMIGERGAQAVLDNLTATAPEEIIPKIQRWVQLAKTREESQAFRELLREYAKVRRNPAVDIGTGIVSSNPYPQQQQNQLLQP